MLGVNAAAEGSQRRMAAVLRMRGEMQFKEERQTKFVVYRWKQRKGDDRTEMKEEAQLLRCALLNGSAWSTWRKYMEKIQRKVRYF